MRCDPLIIFEICTLREVDDSLDIMLTEVTEIMISNECVDVMTTRIGTIGIELSDFNIIRSNHGCWIHVLVERIGNYLIIPLTAVIAMPRELKSLTRSGLIHEEVTSLTIAGWIASHIISHHHLTGTAWRSSKGDQYDHYTISGRAEIG
jgi:hypothetical protein